MSSYSHRFESKEISLSEKLRSQPEAPKELFFHTITWLLMLATEVMMLISIAKDTTLWDWPLIVGILIFIFWARKVGLQSWLIRDRALYQKQWFGIFLITLLIVAIIVILPAIIFLSIQYPKVKFFVFLILRVFFLTGLIYWIIKTGWAIWLGRHYPLLVSLSSQSIRWRPLCSHQYISLNPKNITSIKDVSMGQAIFILTTGEAVILDFGSYQLEDSEKVIKDYLKNQFGWRS